MPPRQREPSAALPAAPGADEVVKALRHPAKRRNIPPAWLEAQGRVEEATKLRHHYNPHVPPVLRVAADGGEPAAADRMPALLQTALERAVSADEAQLLADALRRGRDGPHHARPVGRPDSGLRAAAGRLRRGLAGHANRVRV
jgi:hypothetical protein